MDPSLSGSRRRLRPLLCLLGFKACKLLPLTFALPKRTLTEMSCETWIFLGLKVYRHNKGFSFLFLLLSQTFVVTTGYFKFFFLNFSLEVFFYYAHVVCHRIYVAFEFIEGLQCMRQACCCQDKTISKEV